MVPLVPLSSLSLALLGQGASARSDVLASLRNLRTIAVVAERQVGNDASIPDRIAVVEAATRRLRAKGVAVVGEGPSRRRTDAVLKVQVSELTADDASSFTVTLKLLVPAVLPNDPGAPPAYVLVYEHLQHWIGPQNLEARRFGEILGTWTDAFADDLLTANPSVRQG